MVFRISKGKSRKGPWEEVALRNPTSGNEGSVDMLLSAEGKEAEDRRPRVALCVKRHCFAVDQLDVVKGTYTNL